MITRVKSWRASISASRRIPSSLVSSVSTRRMSRMARSRSLACGDVLARLLERRNCLDLVTFALQQALEQLPPVSIVFDDQNLASHSPSPSGPRSHRERRVYARRQAHGKGRALAWTAVQEIVPPWRSIKVRTHHSPNPSPSALCWNMDHRCAICSGAMPMPVSLTSTTTHAPVSSRLRAGAQLKPLLRLAVHRFAGIGDQLQENVHQQRTALHRRESFTIVAR